LSHHQLLAIADRLSSQLASLAFQEPVTHVYDPLQYARSLYSSYLASYASAPKEVVLLGMNPGPWGMAQTGVPFGDVVTVRDWLLLEGEVSRPAREHPKRPVLGLACPRVEVSGTRLWGWARERFGTPAGFFVRFFVANYCPLSFLEDSGRNRTPDRLHVEERQALFALCDEALRSSVEVLRPTWVIGVGRFARLRAEEALQGLPVGVGEILHPSPASPAANRGWHAQATDQLRTLGIRVP
jgi:single-strand selective monofunctional uracil DNA glycosylase